MRCKIFLGICIIFKILKELFPDFVLLGGEDNSVREAQICIKQRSPPDKPGRLLIKVGDDLLSHFRSTIGAGRLNFSVRNGKRWNPAAIVT